MDGENGEICVRTSSPFFLEWKMPDFLPQFEKFGNYISPKFLFCNQIWRLGILKLSNSSYFINLLLTDNSTKHHHISCNVSLINADGTEFVEIRNASLFTKLSLTLCHFSASKLLQDEKKVELGGTWMICCLLRCTCHLEESLSMIAVKVTGNTLKSALKGFHASSATSIYPTLTRGKEELNEKIANSFTQKGDAICSTKEKVIPDIIDSKKLLRDIEALFFNGKGSDVTLIVQDRKFLVHRTILGARSSVFEAMFSHDVVESTTGEVNITDFDPDVFYNFLLYLYSGKVEKLSLEKAVGLYSAAEKYDTQELKTKCVEFMRDNLSIGMFCSVVSLALQHQDPSLLEAAAKFFVENVKQIIVTVEWQEFLKENPTTANELLIKASRHYLPPKYNP